MKKLLVATDLSVRSDRAVRRAVRLAEEHDAALTVMHIVDRELPHDMAEDLRASAHGRLERFLRSIKERDYDIRVQIDDPILGILNTANGIEADLVVLGVHRARPVVDMFSGTTMERLVRAAERPVLLVADPADHDYDTVLAGIDFSPSCAAAIETAGALAPAAQIKTFHAIHAPFTGFIGKPTSAEDVAPFTDAAKARFAAWRETANLPTSCAEPDYVIESIGPALGARITALKPDLLAVGAHSRAAWTPSRLGSVTEELLRNPPCDILVVRR